MLRLRRLGRRISDWVFTHTDCHVCRTPIRHSWVEDLLYPIERAQCRFGHHNNSCRGRADHVRADGSVIW